MLVQTGSPEAEGRGRAQAVPGRTGATTMARSQALPPRAIFTHNEILHAISLPPLASFLSDLSSPEHLIKLNDILDRFKTPKSYHRVDVRLVESSDLPPDLPEGQKILNLADRTASRGTTQKEAMSTSGDYSDERKERWKREKGQPVVLPEGMGMEEYLLQHPRSPLDAPPAEEEYGDVITAAPRTCPAETDQAVSSSATVTHDLISARAPSHYLPPAAPTRRVRELRLDLRTLDAAALFHLETWRREVLGIRRLDLEVPDSIWYKDQTPSPPPIKASVLMSTGRKRGRPPKRKSESLQPLERPEAVIVNDEATDDDVMEAITTSGIASSPHEVIDGSILDETTKNALESFAEQKGLDRLPLPTPPLLERSASLSPDVILDDILDRREDHDPDFQPPPDRPSASLRKKRLNVPQKRRVQRQRSGDHPIESDVDIREAHVITIDMTADSSSNESNNVGPSSPTSSQTAALSTTKRSGLAKSQLPAYPPDSTPLARATKASKASSLVYVRKRKMIMEAVVIETPKRKRASDISSRGQNASGTVDQTRTALRGSAGSERSVISNPAHDSEQSEACESVETDLRDATNIKIVDAESEVSEPVEKTVAKSGISEEDEWAFLKQL